MLNVLCVAEFAPSSKSVLLKTLALPANGGNSNQGHSDYVLSCRFHPDGRTIATVGHDAMLKFWTLSSGKCIQDIRAHPGPALTCDFTPEGDTLATGGAGGAIKLWDVTGRGAKSTRAYECFKELHGHQVNKIL